MVLLLSLYKGSAGNNDRMRICHQAKNIIQSTENLYQGLVPCTSNGSIEMETSSYLNRNLSLGMHCHQAPLEKMALYCVPQQAAFPVPGDQEAKLFSPRSNFPSLVTGTVKKQAIRLRFWVSGVRSNPRNCVTPPLEGQKSAFDRTDSGPQHKEQSQ